MESSEEIPAGSCDYARIASAPFSYGTYRTDPMYCVIGGLASERGRTMNGKRGWVHGRRGGEPGERARVLYREGDAEPGPFEALRASPAARAANLKVENLRLPRRVVVADPPKRTLLSALAGDAAAGAAPAPGFFVFYPGLRLGAGACLEHGAIRVDVAGLGNWGATISRNATEGEVRERLKEMKESVGLAPDAWDPLDGPGWPGIYTDRSARGVADADPADVVKCGSWVDAWALWAEIEQVVGSRGGGRGGQALKLHYEGGAEVTANAAAASQPYMIPMRCVLPAATKSADFAAAVRWMVAASPLGRSQATNDIGLGVLGAHVIDGDGFCTGVALFSTQGNFAPEDFTSNWENAKFKAAATLDGARFTFEVGRAAYASAADGATPRERPRAREWSALLKSPCGRFTYSAWWNNGSNYDFEESDLEFAP